MPEQTEERFEVELSVKGHIGILYTRSFLKLFGILFIAMEFTWGKFQNLFIALIFLFIVYFTMPTSYRKSEPYKSSEAWFRMAIGLFIALVLLVLLSPGENLLNQASLWNAMAVIIAAAVLVGAVSYSGAPLFISLILSIAAAVVAVMFIPIVFIGKLPNAAPLFFLTLAFFVTSPKVEKDEGGEKIILVGTTGKGTEKIREGFTSDKMEKFGNGLFLTLVLAGGFPIISWMRGGLQLVLIVVWAMSAILGYMSGRQARPYLGIMVIGFAILAFSFQYTGTIGTAVFGSAWTPIYNFGTTTLAPVGKALDTASRQVNYAMCTITAGPGVCEALINPPSQAAGATAALELTSFEAINYRSASPEIDPSLPLVGTISLENHGDFAASNVLVKLQKPIIFDPAKASINNPTAAMQPLDNDDCAFDSCLGTTPDGAQCSWALQFQPKETKVLTFKCGDKDTHSKWGSSVVSTCECRDPRNGQKLANQTISCDSTENCGTMKGKAYVFAGIGGQTKCVCISDKFSDYCSGVAPAAYCTIEDSACKKSDGTWDCTSEACNKACNGQAQRAIKKYTHAGWNLRIGFDYSFSYSTNVSLPVRVMSKTEFTNRLQNKQITLEDVAPVYSGGPVSVGIDLGKQPIRTEDSTIGRIYIKNDGMGKVKKGAVLRLILPSNNLEFLKEPAVISKSFSFKGSAKPNRIESCSFITGPLGKTFSCPLTADLETGEEGTITFEFAYRITDNAVEKNTIFVGGLDYTYEASSNLGFPLVSIPPQQ